LQYVPERKTRVLDEPVLQPERSGCQGFRCACGCARK